MFAFLKLLFVGIVIAGLVAFTPIGAGVRHSVAKKINPSVKQGEVLGAATKNVEAIQKMAQAGDFSTLPPSTYKALTAALDSAQTNLDQAQVIANKTDLAAVVSNLISKIPSSEATSSCQK